MSDRFRSDCSSKIDDVIRSRHYTWLCRGLGGDPIERAMIELTADVMHICRRKGIDFSWLVEQSEARCEQEEQERLARRELPSSTSTRP